MSGWVDGVAIWIAVLLVATVTAANNYSKEKQFRALNAEKNKIDVKVWRDGRRTNLGVGSLTVGDVVELETGDKIPADGVFLRGDGLESNESSLTGEPDDVKKEPKDDPFLLAGCQVTAGAGRMVVVAVGVNSIWGEIKSRLATDEVETPLQVGRAHGDMLSRMRSCAYPNGRRRSWGKWRG